MMAPRRCSPKSGRNRGIPIEPTRTDRSFDPVALALLLRRHFPIIKTEHWGPHG